MAEPIDPLRPAVHGPRGLGMGGDLGYVGDCRSLARHDGPFPCGRQPPSHHSSSPRSGLSRPMSIQRTNAAQLTPAGGSSTGGSFTGTPPARGAGDRPGRTAARTTCATASRRCCCTRCPSVMNVARRLGHDARLTLSTTATSSTSWTTPRKSPPRPPIGPLVRARVSPVCHERNACRA
jgi:hypothetical protein